MSVSVIEWREKPKRALGVEGGKLLGFGHEWDNLLGVLVTIQAQAQAQGEEQQQVLQQVQLPSFPPQGRGRRRRLLTTTT
mgnify:CR=1 FL=1